MKIAIISISNLANRKNIVTILFLVVFAWILYAATPNFYSYYHLGIRNTTYMFLAGVALFFVHNVVLIPIKLKENNTRKYLVLIVACIIVFTFIDTVLFIDIIKGMSNPTRNIFGIDPNQLFNIGSLVKVTAGICIQFLIISVLSAIYCLLVYGFRAVSPYLETFVHIVVLGVLFALVVTVSDIKGKDIGVIFSIVLVFYINTFVVTPILLRRKKTITYLLGLLTLILGYFLLQTILLTIFGYPKFDAETGHPFTEGDFQKIIFSIPALIVLITTIFLSLVYGYVRIKTEAKEQSFNIKLGEKESELKLLKSQVNPHFLFNTLNILYATALNENAERTSESIAKLANLLRYMQKDINKDFIPLENEIKYLQDYIAIQKLRCVIEPIVETQFDNYKNLFISPGLFIPFVENAFKYGIDPLKPSRLVVSVICSNNSIYFSCVNSYNDEFKTFHKEQSLGIGIKNAKQRLKLVYPKNHTFEIIKKNNEFLVKIMLNDHTKNGKI